MTPKHHPRSTSQPTTARAALDSTITEKAFQANVVRFATLSGWTVYHTYDSRRSAAGFPDLVMVRGSRLVFAELKTERGRVSVAQSIWLRALQVVMGKTGGIVSVYVWRPRDWGDIEDVLSGRAGAA